MTTADTLDRGRESFERRAWADAFVQLSAADRDSSLGRRIWGCWPRLRTWWVGTPTVSSYALASSLVGGVGRDAEHIASRQPNGRRRRGPQMADPLLSPEPERASARATLAYHNQVGDPSL